jgi:hypothetical protein
MGRPRGKTDGKEKEKKIVKVEEDRPPDCTDRAHTSALLVHRYNGVTPGQQQSTDTRTQAIGALVSMRALVRWCEVGAPATCGCFVGVPVGA